MTPLESLARDALIGQWVCVLGMLVVFGLMLKRKAREERERAERRAREQGM